MQLLVQSEAAFDASRSNWLQLQNSFNDALTRSLIYQLATHRQPGAMLLVGKDGRLVKFGSLLQPGAPFDKHHFGIAKPFREANDRRNKLPSAHPYDEQRGLLNRHLSSGEQREITKKLAQAYRAAVALAAGFP